MANPVRFAGFVAIIVALLAIVPTVSAEIAVLGADRDNSIFESNALNSGGGLPAFFSGTNAMFSPRRALLAFDIAAEVPDGAQITSVELRLYLGNAPNEDSQNIGLHRLTTDWGEGTVGNDREAISMTGMGFTADPGDATWSHASLDSVSWANPGATGDFVTTPSATAAIAGPIDEPHFWTSTPALVSDVQSWLDNPANNFGWILVNANETSMRTLKAFYSREASQDSSGEPNAIDPTWRPTLMVTYETAATPSGDYNGNGVVDAADYVVWRKTLGLAADPFGSGADGNANGNIDSGDYSYWKARFGNSVPGGSSRIHVPEPTTSALLVSVWPLALIVRRRYKTHR